MGIEGAGLRVTASMSAVRANSSVASADAPICRHSEFFIDNLLVRIHFIIKMIIVSR